MNRRRPILIIISVVVFITMCFYHNQNPEIILKPLNEYLMSNRSISSFLKFSPNEPPWFQRKTKYCNIYKNDTISKNINQISFPKSTIKLPDDMTVNMFHYGNSNLISFHLINTYQWENQTITPLMSILKQDNSLNLIDLGSNLGVYALSAATLGRQVVAVEAMEETCQRNYASILMNKLQNRIVLIQNALSDYRGKFTIKKIPDNVGGSGMVNNTEFTNDTSLTIMQSIYMDDLMEVITFKRAVLKMDIQESEAEALTHAHVLFSQVDIPIVLFEWILYRKRDVKSESIISFFLSKDYHAFSKLEAKEPDLKIVDYLNWPHDIVWKKKPFLYA